MQACACACVFMNNRRAPWSQWEVEIAPQEVTKPKQVSVWGLKGFTLAAANCRRNTRGILLTLFKPVRPQQRRLSLESRCGGRVGVSENRPREGSLGSTCHSEPGIVPVTGPMARTGGEVLWDVRPHAASRCS